MVIVLGYLLRILRTIFDKYRVVSLMHILRHDFGGLHEVVYSTIPEHTKEDGKFVEWSV